MDEKEFLIKFNTDSFTEEYDEQFFQRLFIELKEFLNADKISYQLKESNFTSLDKNKVSTLRNDNDWDFSVCYDTVDVKVQNVKRNLEDKEFFINMLKSILSNVFRNYVIVEKLKYEKNIDKMLDIYNRTAYEELCKKETGFDNVGIAFVDANRLGIINNQYGYAAGDLLLKTVVSCFKKSFNCQDMYRIGGDEFLIVCQNIDENIFKTKLCNSLLLVEDTDYDVSVGYVYRDHVQSLGESIKEASVLMQENKEKYREKHPEKYINKYTIRKNKR